MNTTIRPVLFVLAGIAIGAAGSAALHAQTGARPGYVIGEIEVHDMAAYKTYASQVPATLRPYGGHYLAAGGRTEGVEGPPPPDRFVIIQFPSLDKAKAWHDSPEYQKIVPIRHKAATSRVFLAEGRAAGQ